MPVHNVHPYNHPTAAAPDLLQIFGLLLSIEVNVPQSLANALSNAAIPLPNIVTGNALVDTGASCCCAAESSLQSLQLQAIGQANMSSPNGNRLQNVYLAKLSFPGTPIPALEIPVVGVQLNQGKTIALIGRDLLRHCVLIYNGPMGSYTLSF